MGSPSWESDLITDFIDYTEKSFSPLLFRKWSGISLVAGALERRVWAKIGPPRTYPNLYVLLVAVPGIGKQCVDEVRALWRDALEPGTQFKAFSAAPHNMTKASLIDSLAKAKTARLFRDGLLVYHSLLIAAEEFQVLLPNYDTEYIATLNYMFNSPSMPYQEVRRTGSVRELEIDAPQLNILAGVQPQYFTSTFPEDAWNTGFARRIIMVYAAEGPDYELFQDNTVPEELRGKIVSRLGQMDNIYGQCEWTPEAAQIISSWHNQKGPPRPTHSKLIHYNNSRTMLLTKLCIVSTVSRTGKIVIEAVDVRRAIAWLTEAEALMPDVFREMMGKSDSQVIEEMHLFVTTLWAKNKRQPVSGEAIRKFLLQRLPHEKVETVLIAAERANIIARSAGTLDQWVPKPKQEHGME